MAVAQDYPYRDNSGVVIGGAGGRIDTINRMIMAQIEKHLPVRMSESIVTGGIAGPNSMDNMTNKPADGHALAANPESP